MPLGAPFPLNEVTFLKTQTKPSKWIEKNKEKLQPPVGASLIFTDSQFIIMAVGGPNRRTDYHINSTEVSPTHLQCLFHLF